MNVIYSTSHGYGGFCEINNSTVDMHSREWSVLPYRFLHWSRNDTSILDTLQIQKWNGFWISFRRFNEQKMQITWFFSLLINQFFFFFGCCTKIHRFRYYGSIPSCFLHEYVRRFIYFNFPYVYTFGLSYYIWILLNISDEK